MLCEAKICNFMREVLIPLAVETNAVILCGGLAGICMLTRLLHRMIDFESSTWGNTTPFTVVCYCNIMPPLYRHSARATADGEQKLIWQELCEKSRNWRARHKDIERLAKNGSEMFQTDLEDSMYYIIVDSIDDGNDHKEESLGDDKAMSGLLTEIVSYYQNLIPTLNLKTGASLKDMNFAKSSSGLGGAVDLISSGSPVLFLDSRREEFRSDNYEPSPENVGEDARSQMINEAMFKMRLMRAAVMDDCKEKKSPNFMDCMQLAYLKDALFGNLYKDKALSGDKQIRTAKPLYKAIRDSENGQVDPSAKKSEEKPSRSFMDRMRLVFWKDSETNDMGPKERFDDPRNANKDEVHTAVMELADDFYADCYKLREQDAAEQAKNDGDFTLQKLIEGEKKAGLTPSDYYQEQLWTWVQFAEELLHSPQFQSLNLRDLVAANKTVRHLVRLDRLPKENSIEGLRLLRAAWDEYDVGMHNAGRYKMIAKVIFVLQLLVQVLIVLCTLGSEYVDDWTLGYSRRLEGLPNAPPMRLEDACWWLPQTLGLGESAVAAALQNSCPGFVHSVPGAESSMEATEAAEAARRLLTIGSLNLDFGNKENLLAIAVFALSIMTSTLISVNSYVKPMTRWRNLRSGVVVLESIIWQFRTRVGCFGEASSGNPNSAEQALCATLAEWRAQFAGAGGQGSMLEKKYNAGVFKHYQYSGKPSTKVRDPKPGRDLVWTNDHQSPARPQAYLFSRLYPAMDFYQKRLPWYSMWRTFWTLLLLICTAIATVLAYFKFVFIVALLSALASAITSWAQFRDLGRKIDRYNGAVRHIKELITWWDSLGEVEKASNINAARLVLEGESIITNENTTWNSAGAQAQASAGKGGSGTSEGAAARS